MRSTLTTAIILAAAACVPVQPADTPAQAPASAAIATYRVIQTGSYGAASAGNVDDDSGRRAPFVEIARDAKSYSALWNQHIDASAPPVVDFTRETAVFLLLPPRPTGGYGIKVEDVTLEGATATVAADLEEPGPGQMVTQAFTAPFAVIAVGRSGVTGVEWMNHGRLLATRTAE